MRTIVARVRNGRLVVDEPTDLPEGTELALVADDEGDEMTAAERAELDASLDQALRSAAAGRGRPAAEVLAELAAKRAR